MYLMCRTHVAPTSIYVRFCYQHLRSDQMHLGMSASRIASRTTVLHNFEATLERRASLLVDMLQRDHTSLEILTMPKKDTTMQIDIGQVYHLRTETYSHGRTRAIIFVSNHSICIIGSGIRAN